MGNPFVDDDNEQQPLVATTTTATTTTQSRRLRRDGSAGKDALCTSMWVFLIVTFSIIFLISGTSGSFFLFVSEVECHDPC